MQNDPHHRTRILKPVTCLCVLLLPGEEPHKSISAASISHMDVSSSALPLLPGAGGGPAGEGAMQSSSSVPPLGHPWRAQTGQGVTRPRTSWCGPTVGCLWNASGCLCAWGKLCVSANTGVDGATSPCFPGDPLGSSGSGSRGPLSPWGIQEWGANGTAGVARSVCLLHPRTLHGASRRPSQITSTNLKCREFPDGNSRT